MPDSEDLTTLIDQFLSTETALRQVADAAEQLERSATALDRARQDLTAAEASHASNMADAVAGIAAADAAHAEQLVESEGRVAQSVDEARKRMAESLEVLRTRIADTLSTSEERLESASEENRRRLEAAEREVRDTASQIFELATQLRESARDLGDTATAFRALRPEQLWSELDVVKRQQRATTIAAWCAAGLAAVAAAASIIF